MVLNAFLDKSMLFVSGLYEKLQTWLNDYDQFILEPSHFPTNTNDGVGLI